MKKFFCAALERYFYSPGPFSKLLACALWPLSVLYAAAVCMRSKRVRRRCSMAVFSVGNLTIGGSNKSPFARALADWMAECAHIEFEQIAIILRGYKRDSAGLLEVEFSPGGALVGVARHLDAARFGDEACEHKFLLPKVRVIVCESRDKALSHAQGLGCKVAILDDAFSKFHIEKFDFLLEHFEPKYLPFCLPAGPLRYPKSFKKYADFIAVEGAGYQQFMSVPERLNECFFVCAIARPQRLEPVYSACAGRLILPDHETFNEEQIKKLMQKCGAKRLVCTMKDYVKLSQLREIAEPIGLRIELGAAAKNAVKDYLRSKNVTNYQAN